jgi:hypothetical protein
MGLRKFVFGYETQSTKLDAFHVDHFKDTKDPYSGPVALFF